MNMYQIKVKDWCRGGKETMRENCAEVADLIRLLRPPCRKKNLPEEKRAARKMRTALVVFSVPSNPVRSGQACQPPKSSSMMSSRSTPSSRSILITEEFMMGGPHM